MKKIIALFICTTLAACGFKGNLYLPKENDKNQFDVIQTGIDFRKPNTAPQTASQPATSESQNHE
ncbi:LPS translocon maturation chaperone LptM [Kingella negevensis]|uniref:Lipoprotein n=1 Tax=Kingella negevensis TaxID=1522312 RepID=A0A238HHA6_9NEIS|nr:lipoprotein [Kingella negevensis]MDK4681182.1 lipoprotein [Kingella negevensis]MDK4683380.1 lipoprotein [Kingella negevensis]MDK4685077.1 lipoprotein [Kingella negevensis]MDK4689549.1 lipoprotein [Kingella negevensis]MDK4691485.1 lipoprotein [Kingella negevensis]